MSLPVGTHGTCDICRKDKPLHLDTAGGGGMLCDNCQQMVRMGPEWIDKAIKYLNNYKEKRETNG